MIDGNKMDNYLKNLATNAKAICVFLLLTSISGQTTYADEIKLSASKNEIINNHLSRFDTVSIIVELASSSSMQGLSNSSLKEFSGLSKLSFKSALSKSLTSKIADEFDYFPGMVFNVTAAELEQLKKQPGIKNIYPNQWRKLSLAQTTEIVYPKQQKTPFNGNNEWVVAVLDSGADLNHSFLKSNGVSKVVSEACYSGAGIIDPQVISLCPGRVFSSTGAGSGRSCSGVDGCFHGTHVAGIAVGDRDAEGAIDGVAHKGKLMPIQVFTRINDVPGICGSLPSCIVTADSDWIKGLERVYALRNTFKFAAVNMSLGGRRFSSSCDSENTVATSIINRLRSAGIATIIAAGNDGFGTALSYPACISSAISVGATTNSDEIVSFSNENAQLDLFAPGVDVISSNPGGGFISASGTSMAAPHVAGAFAVIKHAQPDLTVNQIESLLKRVGPAVPLTFISTSRRRLAVRDALKELGLIKNNSIAPILNILLLDEEEEE